MPFYVPLGPRGLIFRAGTWIHNIVGGWIYWRARSRRIASRKTAESSGDDRPAVAEATTQGSS